MTAFTKILYKVNMFFLNYNINAVISMKLTVFISKLIVQGDTCTYI